MIGMKRKKRQTTRLHRQEKTPRSEKAKAGVGNLKK